MSRTSIAAAAVAVLIAAPAAAQDSRSDALLGPMAQALKNRVGTWDLDLTMTPAPGAKPIRIKGQMTSRIVGGRWLVSEMSGGGFQGIGVNGWSPEAHKYVGYWVDGMRGAAIPVEGTYDPATRVFTTRSSEPSGVVVSETRSVSRDREEVTFVGPGPDGKPFQRMAFITTRTK